MKNFVILNNNHVCTLPTDVEYNFNILKACFDYSGTILQLMIALESVDGLDHDVILEEIEIASETFSHFASGIHWNDYTEVIDFDLEKITVTTGRARIKRDNETGRVSLDWEKVAIFNAPFSSAHKYRSDRSEKYTPDEDECIATNSKSEFLILPNFHVCTLPTDVEYDFYIIRACFSPQGDSLQVMIYVENKENNLRDVIYEEFPVNSESFKRFVQHVYVTEKDEVIDFCPDWLSDFWGTVSLKQVGDDISVDWDSVDIESSLQSSAGEIRYTWLEKDESSFKKSCHMRIVNSFINKTVIFSRSLCKKIGLEDSVHMFLSKKTGTLIIANSQFSKKSMSMSLSSDGMKKIDGEEFVKVLTEVFSLDFEKCGVRYFCNITFGEIDNIPVAKIVLNEEAHNDFLHCIVDFEKNAVSSTGKAG